jgi:hypothetical protein
MKSKTLRKVAKGLETLGALGTGVGIVTMFTGIVQGICPGGEAGDFNANLGIGEIFGSVLTFGLGHDYLIGLAKKKEWAAYEQSLKDDPTILDEDFAIYQLSEARRDSTFSPDVGYWNLRQREDTELAEDTALYDGMLGKRDLA